MQTSLQHLREDITLSVLLSEPTKIIVRAFIDNHLEREKEQIIKSYWAGLDGFMNDYSEAKEVGNEIEGINVGGGAEKYYNETYKEKKQ